MVSDGCNKRITAILSCGFPEEISTLMYENGNPDAIYVLCESVQFHNIPRERLTRHDVVQA